jgi:hypothetical protein
VVKTQDPADFKIATGKVFKADAIPDAFDERDLPYIPRLDPLHPTLDQRREAVVLHQDGNSCTGHAVATMINTVLASPELAPRRNGSRRQVKRVSPYMLYRLARRYDEFSGDADVGSSLRGAFKGWLRHGVALDVAWPAIDSPDLDLDDPKVRAQCGEQPLGAYFRINVQRLDDIQSAINELRAIAVSAAIHTGWASPKPMIKPGMDKPILVIRRAPSDELRGGHAFSIVGYNRVGFLVQNSWGTEWGHKGFATLPYDDWLDNAYDAWVARPGVPATPPYVLRNKTTRSTGGGLVNGQGPDVRRLQPYVVNLGDDGKLSQNGRMTSGPRQLDQVVQTMANQHSIWAQSSGNPGTYKRRIVLYAHGGLVDEMGGLSTADRHLNWWLRNEVYPVSFAWESGAVETLMSAMKDLFGVRLPFGGIFGDAQEGWDRFVEGKARPLASPLWDVMKGNGREASSPLSGGPIDFTASQSDEPGASLFVERLKRYVDSAPDGGVEVHLVGHSAGSVFLGALLNRLIERGITVDSMQLLGGAMTAKEFSEAVAPRLGNGLSRFTAFNLSEKREQDDKCPGGPVTLYFKSLLYFVARSLEQLPSPSVRQTPMVGLESALAEPMSVADPRRLGEIIDPSRIVISPTPTGAGEPPPDSRCHAVGHGDLDNDVDTLTSVLLRILRSKTVDATRQYQAFAPAPAGAGAAVGAAKAAAAERFDEAQVAAAATPVEPGQPGPMGAAPPSPVKARPKARSRRADVPESPVPAPTSVDYADMLTEDGWRPAVEPPVARGRARSKAARPTTEKARPRGKASAKA